MSSRVYCDQLLTTLDVIKRGFEAPLDNISDDDLNHIFSDHKMTVGQIAIHCVAWTQYFLAPKDDKPWEVVKWTCRPVSYPLTRLAVDQFIDEGIEVMRNKLLEINDEELEVTKDGEKGYGYIIYRLLIHMMAHSNQMSYLRSLLDANWGFGGHFGDMATAFIKMDYSTDRDLTIGGF